MSQPVGILEALIAALNANTAAHLGKPAVENATDPEKNETAETPAQKKARLAKEAKEKAAAEAKAKKPTHNKQETTDAIVAVKDQLGAPAAKTLLSDFGFAKLADITEDKFDELFDAATDLVGGAGDATEEEEI